MRDLGAVSLRDLLPGSIVDDPQLSVAVDAVDGELQAVSSLTGIPSILARIDELPGDVLDHLAWQLRSLTWRDSWPLSLKRSVIKSLIIEQSKKGTRYALNEAVRSYGAAMSIKEWWETSPQGTPHTFDLVLNLNDLGGELVEAELQEDLLRRIDDVKPVRSQYTFSLATQAEGGLGFQGYLRPVIADRMTLSEAPYGGGIGFEGYLRPVSTLRLSTVEA